MIFGPLPTPKSEVIIFVPKVQLSGKLFTVPDDLRGQGALNLVGGIIFLDFCSLPKGGLFLGGRIFEGSSGVWWLRRGVQLLEKEYF